MDSKMIAFILVGVLVGAGIGAAAGYLIWDDDADDYETYWYYFDFGDEADETNVNQWVKVEAADVVSGLQKAADSVYTDNDIEDTGWINSLNGVSNDFSISLSWANWFLNQATGYNGHGLWYGTPGMNVTAGNVFYIGFYEYDSLTFEPIVDPNYDMSDWRDEGPFAA
jgi:hypothetical protein